MLRRLPVDMIDRDPSQPRKVFDEAALGELAASIEENGLKQPITVRPIGDGRYQIVIGERRWRAHRILQERSEVEVIEILCHVRKMDDATKAIDAIIENLQRVDIGPMEEANAFQQAMEICDLDVAGLAKKLGKQEWRINERLSLLNLRPEYKALFAARQINASQAFEMSRLPHRLQDKLFEAISQGRLDSYNAVRAAATALLEDDAQVEFFPGLAGPHAEERRKMNCMERRIEQVLGMVQAGFTDGEITVLQKVDPDRAAVTADRLELIAKHVLQMAEALGTKAPVQANLEKAA